MNESSDLSKQETQTLDYGSSWAMQIGRTYIFVFEFSFSAIKKEGTKTKIRVKATAAYDILIMI